MPDPSDFQRQAERCLRLARDCSDGTMAERLRAFAKELLDKLESQRTGAVERAGRAPGTQHTAR